MIDATAIRLRYEALEPVLDERGRSRFAAAEARAAGRKPLVATDATLLGDRNDLLDGATRGDPMAPLFWTAKSLRKLAAEVKGRGAAL